MFKLFFSCFIVSALFAKTQIENFLINIELQNSYSGMQNVDCIYVINLEHRFEKWLTTKKGLESYGIYPNRVNAINGWQFSEEVKQSLLGPHPLRLRGGQIGCILSHISALQDANKKGFEIIWVCEDDIEICENPHQISQYLALLSNLDPQWDILYTDSDSKNSEGMRVPSLVSDFRPDLPHFPPSYYIQRRFVHGDIQRIYQRFGAYSLLISKKGIRKILDHFLNNYLWTAYDIDIHYVPNIRQYCIHRDLVSINYKTPSDTTYHYRTN